MADDRQNSVLDTGLHHLGSVYAKALLGATEKTGVTSLVLEELDSFVEDVLRALPKFEATLVSPRVPWEAKERMLQQALDGRASPLLVNFLKVLARRGRFDCIYAVRQAARQLMNELRGRLEVRLTTATPIDQPTRDAIVARLQAALGSEIDLKVSVDEAVLGGVLIRVGDTVYDGSLANQLARLQRDLVAATTHRMQADTNRFAVAN